MRLVTFEYFQQVRFGIASNDGIRDLTQVVPPVASVQAWCALSATARAGAAAQAQSLAPIPMADVRLLAPVPRPSKIVAVGLNYRDHAAESKLPLPQEPLLFAKFPSSITGPHDDIVLPPGDLQADYEAELAVVIGKRASRVDAADALDHVLGYTCLNDVSARALQFADKQWTRGKSLDTFAPMGPWIVTADELGDASGLAIRAVVNGQVLQDSSTSGLIFGVPQIVAYISQMITLEPGDVIATGTPAGVGFARKPPIYLKPGDVVEIEIERIGKITNRVTARDE